MIFDAKKIFREQLATAEARFGKRSHAYKLEVIGRPALTPETVLAPHGDTVYVYYYDGASDDGQRLTLQLAHESIHVMAGAFRRDATVFEEGLAVSFSLDRVSDTYRALAEPTLPELFRNALMRFRELGASNSAIKKLRKHCSIDAITMDRMQKIFGASDSLAAALCERVSVHDADRL
ncbi:MAG TPA: hypothetical protein VKX28_06415 [Xanthobacteraceae bacterium]|nr:hypothetical protein [Xanthobacteraceae bacterium]